MGDGLANRLRLVFIVDVAINMHSTCSLFGLGCVRLLGWETGWKYRMIIVWIQRDNGRNQARRIRSGAKIRTKSC